MRRKAPSPSAPRVRRRRDKLRAQGLRPIQIWVPDTRAPGFAAEAARQAKLVAEATTKADLDYLDRFADDVFHDG
jgi:Protein  of unknown function (DUF3018)